MHWQDDDPKVTINMPKVSLPLICPKSQSMGLIWFIYFDHISVFITGASTFSPLIVIESTTALLCFWQEFYGKKK